MKYLSLHAPIGNSIRYGPRVYGFVYLATRNELLY